MQGVDSSKELLTPELSGGAKTIILDKMKYGSLLRYFYLMVKFYAETLLITL